MFLKNELTRLKALYETIEKVELESFLDDQDIKTIKLEAEYLYTKGKQQSTAQQQHNNSTTTVQQPHNNSTTTDGLLKSDKQSHYTSRLESSLYSYSSATPQWLWFWKMDI